MPNGKLGDNPLSDLAIHGKHPFPKDIEDLLIRIQQAGERLGRFPLGENWPYSPKEFDWEQGKDLEGAKQDLAFFLDMLEAGRGDEIMLDPHTGRPIVEDSA